MYLLKSPRRKKLHETANEKNTRSANFCADQIDVITKFAVITNVVIKRVHCIDSGHVCDVISKTVSSFLKKCLFLKGMNSGSN